MKYIPFYLTVLFFLFSSCYKRELDDLNNFKNNQRVESLKNNEMLRFKTFKLENTPDFIIFGNDNEVSLETEASFSIILEVDGVNKITDVGVKGSVYEYDSQEELLVFRNLTIRSRYFKEQFNVDLIFSFSKLISTEDTRIDRYNLVLTSMILRETGQKIGVGEKATLSNGSIALMRKNEYHLTYYRN